MTTAETALDGFSGDVGSIWCDWRNDGNDAVNWEAEKLYGVEGLGPFDEF